MSEMLGNQYFLARKYKPASAELEKALNRNPKSKKIRRKLIICYAQTCNVNRALDLFISLIKEDIDFIINIDPIADDCPCPELVYELEKIKSNDLNSLDYYLISGILWLYCDLKKSIDNFHEAQKLDSENAQLKYILLKLTSRFEESKINI